MPSLGFHTIHFSPMFGATASVLEVIRLTADAGFDAIGLDLASVDAHGSTVDVVATVADAGLRCSDVAVLLPDPDDDLPTTARRLAALAGAVGAPACVAAVATAVPWDRLVTSLRECAVILADHGCRLAVEFAPYSTLATLGEAVELCEAVGWERAGLVVDSLHFFRSGGPWAELSALAAEQIAMVQWSDAPATRPDTLVGESRHHRLLPGAGGLDLPALAAAIRATGWSGVVGAEILSEGLRRTDPAIAIPAVHSAMASAPAGWSDVAAPWATG